MMAAQSGFKEQYGSLDSLDVSIDQWIFRNFFNSFDISPKAY